MTSSRTIAAIYLLDWLAGDPEWLPHPVRLMGRLTSWGEALLRSPGQSAVEELCAGGALTAGVVTLAYVGSATLIQFAKRLRPGAGTAVEIVLGWTCLATRNLLEESRLVTDALAENNLPRARLQVARIVGRDTEALDEAGIQRAVIETLAESACDGIVAPLAFLALGGVPLAMAYKAINTLDSMIGHADERYYYFGKVGARLDDAANYIPSRLTALAVVIAAGRRHSQTAWQIWRCDGHKHKSPNAGHPESAMAGALRLQLGGVSTYGGERVDTPVLGAGFHSPSLSAARQAMRIVARVSLLAAIAAIAARRLCRQSR